MNVFELLKEKVSLVDEMESRGIDLIPAGRNKLKCRCPFPDHSDGTPSFYISLDQDVELFKCFGCKRGGSVIDFVKYYGDDGQKEFESLKKVAEYLAEKYKIAIDTGDISVLMENDFDKKSIFPIISKSLMSSERIRNFLKESKDIELDYNFVSDYTKNIDEAIYGKDYPMIEVFEDYMKDILDKVKQNRTKNMS